MKSLLCAMFLLATTTNAGPGQIIAEANQKSAYQPDRRQFMNAGMIFDWEQNRIYQVYAQPERITDITLQAGEKLLAIAGGDTQRWTISESDSGQGMATTKHVFVKPHQIDISTNLILSTDRRVYHIDLHAREDVPYQAVVSWNYPGSLLFFSQSHAQLEEKKLAEQTALSGLDLKQADFRYHFVAKKRPRWMPKRVFNDGHKTYIEFPETMQDGEAPALWGLSSAKENEVINYRRHKNFYIVDYLFDLAELSSGDKDKIVVGIEREVKS
jgi:type IV secretion system protein TrbG